MKKLAMQLLAIMLIVCLGASFIIACDLNEKQYTVTFVAGGGVGDAPEAEKHKEGDTFNLKGTDVFTRDGYVFTGWNDGSKTYDAESEYTMPDKDVIFTAQWREQASLEGKWTGGKVDGEDIIGADSLDVEATIKRDGEEGIYIVLALSGELNEQMGSGGSADQNGNGADENSDDDQGPEDNLNLDNDQNPEDNMSNEAQNRNAGIKNGAVGDESLDSNEAGNGMTGGESGNGATGGESGNGMTGGASSEGNSNSTENGNENTITMCAAFYLPMGENGSYSVEGCEVSFKDEKLTISMSFGSADVQKIEFTSWTRLGSAPSVSGTYTAEDESGDVYTITFGEDPSFSIKRAINNEEDLGGGQSEDDSAQNNAGDSSDDMSDGSGSDRSNGQEQSGVGTDGSKTGSDIRRNFDDMGAQNRRNYDDQIMPISGDDESGPTSGTDGDGELGDEDDGGVPGTGGSSGEPGAGGDSGVPGTGGDSGVPGADESIQTYEVDDIISVGEYLVVFVKKPVQEMQSSQNTEESIPVLVLYAGENDALIANTGEGERLIFSKTQDVAR